MHIYQPLVNNVGPVAQQGPAPKPALFPFHCWPVLVLPAPFLLFYAESDSFWPPFLPVLCRKWPLLASLSLCFMPEMAPFGLLFSCFMPEMAPFGLSFSLVLYEKGPSCLPGIPPGMPSHLPRGVPSPRYTLPPTLFVGSPPPGQHCRPRRVAGTSTPVCAGFCTFGRGVEGGWEGPEDLSEHALLVTFSQECEGYRGYYRCISR